MARESLNQVAILSFSTLSMTCATLVELDRRAVAIGHDHVAVVGGVRHGAGGEQRHRLRSGPCSVPTGVEELALATTLRMSSSEMLRAAAATGSTWTRTANFCAP